MIRPLWFALWLGAALEHDQPRAVQVTGTGVAAALEDITPHHAARKDVPPPPRTHQPARKDVGSDGSFRNEERRAEEIRPSSGIREQVAFGPYDDLAEVELVVEAGVVRNGTPAAAREKSLAQLELAQTEAMVSAAQAEAAAGLAHFAAAGSALLAGAGGPFFCFGRAAGALCSCLAAVAIFAYCGKLCFGEKSCWYTWPICKKLRLALHFDELPSIMVQCTIHRARDLGPGQAIFIAVLPRRGKSGRTKPKLSKGAVAMTAATTDLKWEQHLNVPVEQGCDVLQICAFKKARIGKGTLIGWDNVRITDLLNKDMEPLTRKWIYLSSDEGSPVGSCNITIPMPEVDTKGKKSRKDGTRKHEPPEDTSMPSVHGLNEAETLEAYAKALSGPLNQANKLGEYNLRYFRIEQKRDVWIWAWYKEKNPQPGAKPLGRIPLLSVSTIYEVPHSISEFIVRYRDATDRAVDMMLQRHERPREWWVKTLHSMLALLRDKRKRRKAETQSERAQLRSGGLDVPRSSHRAKSDGSDRGSRHEHSHSSEGESSSRHKRDKSPGSWSDNSSEPPSSARGE